MRAFVILSHWCSTLMYVECIWYTKKTFFADLFVHCANLWFFSCLLPGMFGWKLLLQVLFTSLPWISCLSSKPQAPGGGGAFVIQYIHHFILGFGGNWTRVWPLELYSPVAWWKPNNHSYCFIDVEQAKFQFASCAVVHCWIFTSWVYTLEKGQS